MITSRQHSLFSKLSVASPMPQLILKPFRRFTYVTTHSQTLPSLTYVTAHSPTLPLLHLRHSSFANPSFASPTSQALHLIHLASRPCSVLTTMLSRTLRIHHRINLLEPSFLTSGPTNSVIIMSYRGMHSQTLE